MKVSEAKQKICPFMPVIWHSSHDKNLHMAMTKCICGDCMAWKWDENGAHSTDQNGTIWHEGYCSRLPQ